jgi:hypothetical protein
MKGLLGLVLALGLVPATGGAAGLPAREDPDPTEAGRPVDVSDTTGTADPEEASIELIQGRLQEHNDDGVVIACEEYRKEFPNGRMWIQASAIELFVLLESPSTMQRATDLYSEIIRTYPDPDGEMVPVLKLWLGLALARDGVVEPARRLLREAAADPEFASDPENAELFRQQLAELDAIGKPEPILIDGAAR